QPGCGAPSWADSLQRMIGARARKLPRLLCGSLCHRHGCAGAALARCPVWIRDRGKCHVIDKDQCATARRKITRRSVARCRTAAQAGDPANPAISALIKRAWIANARIRMPVEQWTSVHLTRRTAVSRAQVAVLA